ncbi:hypothetical protein BV898_15277 [Hypsibius exemplaris]|uniref:BTB domain-containing protein n=1 Tax=Hypsibius exemplaris TaxID=2072580 RepID=A0A9X6NHI6_HYPEX|nr:hypothetical protein BV898_15277 [Hypsibius exemplaris]
MMSLAVVTPVPIITPPAAEVELREVYITNNLHLDISSTLKWRIDNFALLSMRHAEIRSPEFEGPKGTRWVLTLCLGDPRLRKAEERFVEGQMTCTHCPLDAMDYPVHAGHRFYSDDESFLVAGAVDLEDTCAVTRQPDPNLVYYSWQYPNSLTTLFTDKCAVNGSLRLAVTVAFDHESVCGAKRYENRRLQFPMDMPHFIPDMLFLNDLFFVCHGGERVPAHKAFMREVSSVFREAIDSMGSSTEISLKQFHKEAVTAFIVYCYTGVLHETAIRGFGVQVLKLGHMFNATAAVQEAADYLLRNVETEGELRCFKIASEYGAHTQLRKAALKLIAKRYPDVLDSAEATSGCFSHENMAELKKQLMLLKSCSEGC